MSSDPAKVVLSALFTNDVFLIDELSRSLNEHHFVDPSLRALYRGVLTYRSIAGGLLTADAVEHLVSDADAGSAAVIKEHFAALVRESVDPAEARWAVQQLRLAREKWLTTQLLRDSTEILTSSVTEEDSGRVWSGAADAREWMAARLAEIDAEISVDESPAGDVHKEAFDVIAVYQAAKSEDRSKRPLTSVSKLDDITGGFGPGELVTVAAPSGVGKSHSLIHISYHAAAVQGLHVYFATSETVRNTVRWRLIAHHSMAAKFTEIREHLQLPYGLDSNVLKRGQLANDDQLRFFTLVVQDLARLDGSLWLAQMPHGQTIPVLDAQMRQRSRARKIDLVAVDYLALMSSGAKHYASTREEYVSLIKGAKHLAIDYNHGNGVPLMTPWQLNRQSQEEMDRTGEVNLRGLADTSEIVNSSDIVMSLSPDGSRDGRFANLRLGLLKYRDGNVLLGGDAIPVRMDYATSSLTPRVSASGNDDVWSGTSFDDTEASQLLLGGGI